MDNSAMSIKREFESREELLDELFEHLQTAIKLEHSTLPFYFYMYWSIALHPDFANAPKKLIEAASGIREVIMEEMLHFALVCNILKAMGGSPGIKGDYTPKYPGPLPGHSTKHQFIVHLDKCDFHAIVTAMRIERPAVPGQKLINDEYHTIGQFYEHIINLIQDPLLTDEDFKHGGQMPQWGGKSSIALYSNMPAKHDREAFWVDVDSKDSAIKALIEITEQGEGFQDTVYEGPDKDHISHFGTFLAIYTELGGWLPKNVDYEDFHKPNFIDKIIGGLFDMVKYTAFQRNIIHLVKDPAQNKHLYSEEGLKANLEFNRVYSRMLDDMHDSFNSEMPRVIDFSLMFGLQEAAKNVVKHPLKNGKGFCGPSFEYLPLE